MIEQFVCPNCYYTFEVDWDFGDNVICPQCREEFVTDYDETEEGIIGPWLIMR